MRRRLAMVMVLLMGGVAGCGPRDESIPLTFAPGDLESEQRPFFSPKGTKLALATSDAHPDRLVAWLVLEGAGSRHLIELRRTEPDGPFDRMDVTCVTPTAVTEGPSVQGEVKGDPTRTWMSFEVTLPPCGPLSEPFPISAWHVLEDGETLPSMLRFTRRGYHRAPARLDGRDVVVLLCDGDNDGLVGEKDEDWWTVADASLAKPFGHERARRIGDFAWEDSRAWLLEMTPGERAGRLRPHDPGVTEAQDAENRDVHRDDRMAPRAAQAMTFRADGEAALADARAAGKPVLVVFSSEWCGPCHEMEALVFPSQAVTDAAKRFECVRLDADEHRDLVKAFGVTGYPTVLTLSPTGQETSRQVGYLGVRAMSALLEAAGGRVPGP